MRWITKQFKSQTELRKKQSDSTFNGADLDMEYIKKR